MSSSKTRKNYLVIYRLWVGLNKIIYVRCLEQCPALSGIMIVVTIFKGKVGILMLWIALFSQGA